MTSSFDVARFRAGWQERNLALGEPMTAVPVTGSTNDDAMSAALQGAPHGATFVADRQTAGRGRRRRAWLSPAGSNLLCSIVLRPVLSAGQSSALTLAVGLAVRDALAPMVRPPVLVKWPNDVVVRGRKLAGILVESRLAGDVVDVLVVGVGVNVAMRDLPEEIRHIATSLALLGADVGRETVLLEVLSQIDRRAREYEERGLETMISDLRRADALLGRHVTVDGASGIARGISDDGCLLFEGKRGLVEIVSAEVEGAPPE